jgi:hypothetical protein
LDPHQLSQIHVLQGSGGVRTYSGQEQQVGEDGLKPVDLVERPVQHFTQIGFVGMEPGLLQLRAQSRDWRAQFVCGIGDELPLLVQCSSRLFFGLFESSQRVVHGARQAAQWPALWPPSTCRISPVTNGAFSK